MIRTLIQILAALFFSLAIFSACGGSEELQPLDETESAAYYADFSDIPPGPNHPLCADLVCICDRWDPSKTINVTCQDDPRIVMCTADACKSCYEYCRDAGGGSSSLGPTR